VAREAFSVLSENRSGVSHWLGLHSDREIEQALRNVPVVTCAENNPRAVAGSGRE
jgi:hypothetical protein